MNGPKKVVEELLSSIDVVVGGDNPWDIRVHDDRMYSRILAEKNLGLGESYMDGWWDCDRLDDFIARLLVGGLQEKVKGGLKLLFPVVQAKLFNRQSKARSKEVAERHYDLGNDLFTSFLDEYRQYSCAYFNGADDINEAQQNKLELICRKLNLSEGDRVLDIGSGWGGLAKYAAEKYGCRVTGINISDEQIAYAEHFCEGLPVEILKCDYREVTGCYDKIVSVGMFEHVGYKNYRAFMETAHRCLNTDGILLLHTIGGNESSFQIDPWMSKHIFPNGVLPSVSQIATSIEGLFVMEDFHNLAPHYDKTLMAWHRAFLHAWPRLSSAYDERFRRMWEYYLLSAAGAFRARYNQLWQIVFTKYGTPQPACRF